MGRILGVDLGARRIGLAVSDPSGTLASPHGTIERSSDPAEDRRRLVATAREVEADRIVVGLPRSLDGRAGPAARAALSEVEELRRIAGPEIVVDTHDERFSTVSAQRQLAEAGVRARRRKAVIDQTAAAVILQSYLESTQA
jgi:putative Holliday junction resolvase